MAKIPLTPYEDRFAPVPPPHPTKMRSPQRNPPPHTTSVDSGDPSTTPTRVLRSRAAHSGIDVFCCRHAISGYET
ncbi:hypothetical protein Y032_0058g2886 [Ancylostoma ceylanicum]|uniref:Uncharacterized protein n=1 Tax=Ancylostoma ceylanicum TaxID=53326 RepID=A0A016U4Z0_9BILA|nr:hypothetical protein Y032_0058g2886 [Ancylostoma ceylanicum]